MSREWDELRLYGLEGMNQTSQMNDQFVGGGVDQLFPQQQNPALQHLNIGLGQEQNCSSAPFFLQPHGNNVVYGGGGGGGHHTYFPPPYTQPADHSHFNSHYVPPAQQHLVHHNQFPTQPPPIDQHAELPTTHHHDTVPAVPPKDPASGTCTRKLKQKVKDPKKCQADTKYRKKKKEECQEDKHLIMKLTEKNEWLTQQLLSKSNAWEGFLQLHIELQKSVNDHSVSVNELRAQTTAQGCTISQLKEEIERLKALNNTIQHTNEHELSAAKGKRKLGGKEGEGREETRKQAKLEIID